MAVHPRYQAAPFGRWIVVAASVALVFTMQASPVKAAAIEPLGGCATNTLPANDDESTGAVDLGFTAKFFDASYTSLYVNNNGNVTFGSATPAFDPGPLVDAGVPIIAPFWADVDTTGPGSGLVTYGTTTFDGHPAFCVNWDGVGVGYFASHDDKLNKFQLLLVERSDVNPEDFDILFNYDQIQWETGDASGGFEGLGGNSARAGYSNGVPETPASSFELPGSAENGAFLDSNTSTGLIYNSRDSAVLGRYAFQVRNGEPVTGAADLSAFSADSPDPVSPSAPVRYTFDVNNAGPDTATNTTLNGQLPEGTDFLGSDRCTTTPERDVLCDLGSITAGTTETTTIDLRAPSAAGDFTFEMFASSPEDPPGAFAQETTTVTDPGTTPDEGGGFATGTGSTTVQTTPDSLQFSVITVPTGVTGAVTLQEVDDPNCPLALPATCVGQRLDLTAPTTSGPATPLVLKILVAKSEFSVRLSIKNAVVAHDSNQIPVCGKRKGTASPDPCLSSVKGMNVGGVAYWQYLVYTTTNGSWRPGIIPR